MRVRRGRYGRWELAWRKRHKGATKIEFAAHHLLRGFEARARESVLRARTVRRGVEVKTRSGNSKACPLQAGKYECSWNLADAIQAVLANG